MCGWRASIVLPTTTIEAARPPLRSGDSGYIRPEKPNRATSSAYINALGMTAGILPKRPDSLGSMPTLVGVNFRSAHRAADSSDL